MVIAYRSRESASDVVFDGLKSAVARIGNNLAARSRVTRNFALSRIKTKKLPPILINTMQKSGSIYLTRTIATSLGIEYSLVSLASGIFPSYCMMPAAFKRFRRGSIVRQEHFDASHFNLEICARYVDRIVLHLRDPRQSTLSWTHHFNRYRDIHPGSTVGTVHRPPEDFCRWPFERQLDWHIDHHLVSQVMWLRRWMLVEQEAPFQILRTRYEELLNNERALFDRILAFYDIPAGGIAMRTPEKTIEYHYRCGRSDEWKEVFTSGQKRRSRTIIGNDILEHFGWDTD